VVDETQGFGSSQPRHTGLVDGTENLKVHSAGPPPSLREVPILRRGRRHVQKYLHDMASWESLSVTERSW